MDPLILSILLLLLGLVFILLELFIPSGGVLSCLAALSVLAAIVVAFTRSFLFGTILLAAAALAIPILVALAIRLWPRTPLGRRVLLRRPSSEEVLPDTEEYQQLKSLIGRRGRAKHDMLPGGMILLEGREYDAVSEGMPIRAGQAVRVVEVQANHIIVRPVGSDEPADDQPSEEDLLSRPIESLGLDPFDDPLA